MADLTPTPVKGMLRAFHRGTVLTKRICKAAQNGSAVELLNILEPAQALGKSFGASEARLRKAYEDSIKTFGRQFAEAILDDSAITNRLQALTINLKDDIDSLDEYMDDPEAFDIGSLQHIKRESERSCEQAIHTLGMLHDAMVGDLQRQATDDRSQLSSQRQNIPVPAPNKDATSSYGSKNGGLGIMSIPTTRKPVASSSNKNGSPMGSNERPRAISGSSSTGSWPRNSEGRLIGSPSKENPSKSSGGRLHIPGEDLASRNSDSRLSMNLSPDSLNIPTGNSFGSYKGEEVMPPPPPPMIWSLPTNEVSEAMKAYESTTALNHSKGSAIQTQSTKAVLESDNLQTRDRAPTYMSQSETSNNSYTNGEDEGSTAAWIKREEVLRQMLINEQLLEKRRRSRLSFLESLDPKYLPSIKTPNSNTTHNSADGSPSMFSSNSIASPSTQTRPSSELLSLGRPTSSDMFSSQLRDIPARSSTTTTNTSTNGSRHSMNSDTQHGRDSRLSHTSLSEPMMFGPLESPQPGDGLHSAGEDWGILAGSARPAVPLKSPNPNFGRGVEDGIQVVGSGMISDPGLILAEEVHPTSPTTPAISITALDHTIGPNASFYLHGGFCKGAKMVLGKEPEAMKIRRTPSATPFQTGHISMKCQKCEYEIAYEIYENDKALKPAGIYKLPAVSGVRFRQRFFSKSHLMSRSTLDGAYACLFCMEEGSTIETHDATVFFSVTQLLKHISRHARPLRRVEGVNVIYGDSSHNMDFDLSFSSYEPEPNPLEGTEQKFRARPSAIAIQDHREGSRGFRDIDPEGNKSMRFAKGATIVGITYPAQYNGNWCCGYHDSERGFFPSLTIALNLPLKDSIYMNQKSTLVARAKWGTPKTLTKENGWLSFKATEKITNISFPYQDYWCWSGMNQKGKYGLFPSTFVDGLCDSKAGGWGPVSGIAGKVAESVKQHVDEGARSRWGSNMGPGMFMGVGSPSPTLGGDPNAHLYAANAPRPVRKSKAGSVSFGSQSLPSPRGSGTFSAGSGSGSGGLSPAPAGGFGILNAQWNGANRVPGPSSSVGSIEEEEKDVVGSPRSGNGSVTGSVGHGWSIGRSASKSFGFSLGKRSSTSGST